VQKRQGAFAVKNKKDEAKKNGKYLEVVDKLFTKQ
jgi:hypothetical protein